MGDDGAEALGIAHHPPQHAAVQDRAVGVGDVAGAGLVHEADLGHLLAPEALGGGAGGIDVHQAGVAGPAQDEVDHGRLVDHRIGVGLDHHGGDPACGGGPAGGFQRLLGLGPGLAGLDPDVDQAGGQEGAVAIDQFEVMRSGLQGRALHHLGDHPILHDHRAGAIVAALRIDQPGVGQGQRPGLRRAGHQAFSRRRARAARMAMRTATPIST